MREYDIFCDSCKELIHKAGQPTEGFLRDRQIGKADGSPVIERFFECPHCGAHYTVTVIDRKMRLLMQRRIQIQRKVGEALKAGNKKRAEKLMKETAEVKKQLKERADKMKEVYAHETERREGSHPAG